MFRKRMMPVWVGILVLSGMFLLGQDTWGPPVVVVVFPDPNLEHAVRNAFDPPLVGDILATDLLKLTKLWAYHEDIQDLTGLEYCSSLTFLELYCNDITDLTPLAGLTKLYWLDLRSNQISDIAPLVANAGLGASDCVYLNNNPLSHASCTIHVPALKGRGVIVYDDC